MNFQGKNKFIKDNIIFYLWGLLIILGIKYFYSKAGSVELRWILAPTTWWVEILSGIPFEYEPSAGYVNHNLRFLIAPSCSGVQFMIITIGMLIFSFVHRVGTGTVQQDCRTFDLNSAAKKMITHSSRLLRICWVPLCVLLSYPLTVFINGLRIIVAMYLPDFLDRFGILGRFLTSDRLHTVIGIAVYFVSLLVIYHLADHILPGTAICSKTQPARKFLPPLFWYFSIALGLPFLNRAYRKNSEQFSEYATLIVSVCAIILILYCLIFMVRKLFQKSAV